jgi:outer membrane protein assembly factor BamB/enterochelin esterase-like enzyme
MMHSSIVFQRFLAVLSFSFFLAQVPAALFAEGVEWPRYRGPAGDGISLETGVFDGLEDLALEVVWKRSIGSAYSGIVIADGRAVTMFAAEQSDVMAAFDTANGEELWRYAFGATYSGHDGSHDGPISTPLISDGRVFGLGPRGHLFALDVKSGEEVWKVHLVEEQGIEKPHYGFGTSPILEGGVLVVELGGEETAVAGFDPTTGERRWVVGSDSVGYQTPVSWTLGGRQQIVAVGQKRLFGIDAARGELLWEIEHEGNGGPGISSLTPVPTGEGQLFLAYQTDSSMLVALRQDGESGGVVLEKTWEGRAIRNSYNVPVFHQGYIYAFSSRFLTCVDAATGEARWRSRQPGDGFLSLVDGRLVIITKAGGVYVAEASPEGYQELAGAEVFGDIAWPAPSFSRGSIYVRSTGELARLDLKAGGGHSSAQVAQDTTSSPFGGFLAEVEAAQEGQKKAVVDRFFEAQKTFPVVTNEQVHFLYRGPAADMALAGFMFGARREEPMLRIAGTDVFYYSFDLEDDARLDYLFIEDFKERRDPLNKRYSGTTVVGTGMEMNGSGEELPMSWFAMPAWISPTHLEAAAEGGRGTLEQHELEHEALEERKIGLTVYLPKGYDPEGASRYPVAFVHDGSSALERGEVANSLDNLLGKSVMPVIVAFVDIPARGPQYSTIFLETLVPFVDEHYRTRTDAASRANLGTGFPGAMALLLTLDHSELFGQAGIQSPFMFSQLEAMAAESIRGVGEHRPHIYLEWGKYDFRNPHEGWDMAKVGRELAVQLDAQGIAHVGGEVHDSTDWSSWKNRTDRLFEALFPFKPGS